MSDVHNCLYCNVLTVSDSDFCSDECEQSCLSRNDRQQKILYCLEAILNDASTEGCEDSAVVNLKLINDARKLLKLPLLKPNGE